MELLALLFITLILIFIISYYLTGKDLLSPPVIMAGMFMLSSFFALLNAEAWHIDYSFKAYIIIISGVLAFSLPFYILNTDVTNKMRRICPALKDDVHSLHLARWKIWATIFLDIVIVAVYWISISRLVRNDGYMGDNIQWYFRTLTNYQAEESLGGFIRIIIKVVDVTSYLFIYVFVNNVLICKERIKTNLLLFIPPLLFSVKTLMSGGRQDLLKLISFTIICSYLLNCQKARWKRNISVKYILIGLCSFVVVLPAFYYALSLAGRSTTRTMFQTISTYVGGPIQHFNQYVNDPIPPSDFWGNETFVPVLNTLGSIGLIDYHNSVHLEYRQLGVTTGNVYTFFRRPLQDFGLLGMYIFVIFVALFFALFYYTQIKYRPANLKTDLKLVVYSYLLYWIVLSSIEQYSMTIISVHTAITLILFVVFWKCYFFVDIQDWKIKYYPHRK